jgi:hypothetical protein
MTALRPGGPGQNGVPPHQGPGQGTVPPHQRPGRTVLPPSQRPGQRPPAAGTPFFTAPFDVAGRDPYTPGELTLLALAGLGIALGGALGPAVWAAASRTTTALRAELCPGRRSAAEDVVGERFGLGRGRVVSLPPEYLTSPSGRGHAIASCGSTRERLR